MSLTLKLGGFLATLSLILAACSAPTVTLTAAPSTRPTIARTAAPTTAPTAPPTQAPPLLPAGDLSGDLEVWHTYGSITPGATRGEPAALEAALEVVRAENPDLNLTVIEVGLADLYNTYQDAATDGVPDLSIAPNNFMGDLYRAGLSQDLTSYFTTDELAHFSDLAKDGSIVDGNLVQVPESVSAVAIYYDASKIASFPATTADLLTAIQNEDFRFGLMQDIYTVFGFWGSFGGELMDDSGRCVAAATAVPAAYRYYADLKAAGVTWYSDYANMAVAFNSGEVDAIVDGPLAGPTYQGTHAGNLGVAPLPSGAGGSALPITGVDGWTINPNGYNIDLAVEFAKRMTQPDILKVFADLAVHIPADTSVTSEDPLAAQFAAALQSGLPRPQLPQLGAFWGNFGDALNRVLDESADPIEAVDTACASMNRANGL